MLEEQGAVHGCKEAYKRSIFLLQKLIEDGEPDSGELSIYQNKLAALELARDERRLTHQPTQISQDEFRELESIHRNHLFHKKKSDKLSQNEAIPSAYEVFSLDGQDKVFYAQQFHRYLVQGDRPGTCLRIKVLDNGANVYEEKIQIPTTGTSWEHYLTSDEMLLAPKTVLTSQFGLDLRLNVVSDPYHNFSLIIAQNGSDAKYSFLFFLDDLYLYDLHFVPPLPWQLEALYKPASCSITTPLPQYPTTGIIPIEGNSTDTVTAEMRHPILELFVKEMKGDPLAITQYVYNEIECVDPFQTRKNDVFIAPGIQRSPLRTFLEKQGSPWEQCTLLATLLQYAKCQTQYIVGTCSLPVSFVEELLFLQLPGEQEVTLDYPGVMLSEGNERITLFPWMKEVHTIEGQDLYSLMPEKYGNAHRWLKQYLCNDEQILKHIGPDGDDTVGLLFVRFVEEELRKQGRSLQDVGTHRFISKKQFNTWDEFTRPNIKGDFKAVADISSKDNRYAGIKVIVSSEQHPERSFSTDWMNMAYFSCDSFAIYFTPKGSDYQLHFCASSNWNNQFILPLDSTDHTINIKVLYHMPFSPLDAFETNNHFSITKGTCAALCVTPGSVNAALTSFFAEQFDQKDSQQEKLQALFSLIGTAYFEKCSRSQKILAALHKVSSRLHFCVGLSKLSPDRSSPSDLRFPQVDMDRNGVLLKNHLHPFSKYQEGNSAYDQYHLLVNADASSNEHQILREFYEDPHAISTVKLLQIAHHEHKSKGGTGPGFLVFTSKNFADADLNPEAARLLYFSNIADVNFQQLKNVEKIQWDRLHSTLIKNDQAHAYAYMTPCAISSRDGYELKPPSYTGIATLIHTVSTQSALISDSSRIMNGGYGSRLSDNFLQTITNSERQLVSNGSNYSLVSSKYAPLFNGITSIQSASSYQLPVFTITNESTDSYTWWNDSLWAVPVTTQWKADVRPEHKSAWEMVADPVDIVTRAFYVDEVDINLPGPFPLEIRRNYNSQNSLPGIFGFGWKLSLNPYLFEEENKIFVSEQDGTIIVYRRDDSQSRWIILPEDNPDLRNFNQQGMGSTANPFHAYIEKNGDYILYGTDGSERVFRDKLLKTWSDHAGNTLTFSYEDELLKRIESSSGGFLCFEYNHSGKISEAYAKDGRRIIYTYDSQGNLATVKLPNDAVISYDYDRFHRIIRESKPHGRVLENIYKDNKVIEQRSPVGLQQHIVTSATFTYADNTTTVTDAAGGCTEYKIYNKQIYKITDPEEHQTLQSWFLDSHTYFDAQTEQIQEWDQLGGYPRSLKSSVDKRGLSTNYLYDSRGNITEITLTGNDLTGKGETCVSKHFSYNVNDLCIEEETLNTKILTTYDSTSPYVPQRIERYADNTLISFIDLEYTAHRMVSKKNESGAITLFKYDDRDFPLKKTQKTGTDDPDVITYFHYNNQGQCTKLIKADSIQCNEYDIMGNCYRSTMSLPSGKIVSQTQAGYDLNNELIWKQGDDPNNTLFFDYNAASLLKASRKDLSQFNGSSMEPAGVAYTLYEYDACGRLIEEVDPLGNCTYCNYDALGRVLHSTKHGLTTTFTYESGGLVASVTTPNGATASRSYTTNGLLKSEIYPDGTENSYIYDFMGRPIQETKNGVALTIRYDDALNQEVQSQGELSEIRQFDAHGNLLSFTDRAGFIWTKTYDALNRVKTETSPNGDIKKWNYQGDTIVCTLPSGEKTIQRYEAGALAESKTLHCNGSLINTTGYKKCLAQSMTEEIHGDIVTMTWTNTLGLPVHIRQGTKTSTHYYDACGNCVISIDGEGNITHQEFDPIGRLKQKKLPDGALITYDYDAASNLIAYHMPGNLIWKATYDSVGHKRSEWQEMDGEAFQRWEYTYTNSLLSQAKDPLNRLHEYTYDTHSRIIQEQVGNYSRAYTYDPRGLIASVTESGKDTSKVERAYDESGRLVNETISLNGITIQNTTQ
ncbi:MAG: DUF6531 domain-containing protein, partial [Parachlamydiaceae bacterium]